MTETQWALYFYFKKKEMSIEHFLRGPQEWGEVFGFDERLIEQADKIESLCTSEGISLTWPGHSEYPELCLPARDWPRVLFYEGQLQCLNKPRVAIVGAREPLPETKRWLDRYLVDCLLDYDLTVVSGGARGVDQTAHFSAIRAGKPTAVLLPTGLRNLYPKELDLWRESVAQTGGVWLSEYPPNFEIYKSAFHARNRIIAGLAHLLFVAEAGLRSGTMITAKWAMQNGVTTAVLPMFPHGEKTRGSLNLINDGAFGIRDDVDFRVLWDCQLAKYSMSDPQKRYSYI